METVQSQMQQLQVQQTPKVNSFLDVLGFDVDKKLLPMTYNVSTTNSEITQQSTYSPGQQFTLQIQTEGLHYLHKSCLLFELVLDKGYYAQNLLHILSCDQLKIGNVNYSFNEPVYLQEQLFCKTNQSLLSKYKLGVKDPMILGAINNQYLGGEPVSKSSAIIPIVSNTGVITFETVDSAQKLPKAIQDQLRSHFLTLNEGSTSEYNIVKCCLPLHLLCPAISQLPDHGSIFVNRQQTVQFTFRLMNASECLLNLNPEAISSPSYSIRQLAFLDCYSMLDQQQTDMIQGSSFQLPIQTYAKYKEPTMKNVVNAYFTVARFQRLKKLMFSFHTNTQAGISTEANSFINNMYTTTNSSFKSPVAYHPYLPISSIYIQVGPKQYQLNVHTLINLGVLDLSTSDDYDYYSEDFYKKGFKWVLSIDMQRFPIDMFGSSSDTQQILLQIQMKTGVRAFCQGELVTDQVLERFALQSHVIYQEFIECSSGIYKNSY